MVLKLDNQSEQNLELLIREIKRDQCCVFVGSGLSIPAGYPGWLELVENLCKVASGKTGGDYYDHSKDNRRLIEECRNVLSEDEYRNFMVSAFHPNGRERFRPIHQTLRHIPFHGYLTTNYDLCIENAGIELGQSIQTRYFPELDISRIREKDVYHIHGVLEPNEIDKTIGTLVLSERDYEFAYEQDGLIPGFLKQLFPYHTIVFIGYSLGDEDITKVIKTVQLELHNRSAFEAREGIGIRKPFQHFIFLHQKEDETQEKIEELDTSVKNLSLLPIYYSGESLRHSELEILLEIVRDKTANLPVPKINLYRDVFEGESHE